MATEPVSGPDVEETTLLGDLGYETEYVPALGSSPTTARRSPAAEGRRWYFAIAGGLALLLVVGFAAFSVVRSAQQRPVHDAFESAQNAFAADVRRLRTASDMERVQAAGQRFGADLPSLRADERTIAGSTDDFAQAAHRVLVAEVSFAAAAAKLARVPSGEFTWFSPIHTTLDRATGDLKAATKVLAGVDENAADSVAAGGDALTSVETIVGAQVAAAAKARLAGLLGDLADASRTGEIRKVASAASLEGAAVRTAASTAPAGGREAERLKAFASVYSRVGALAVLDGEHLDRWASLRAPLTTALAASDPDILERSAGRTAVANVERIVQRGKAALADWKLAYDTALERRTQDLRALQDYKTDMDGQLRTYSALRSELSKWVDTVKAPSSYVSYDEAYQVLSRASSDRWAVREKMASLTVPAEALDAHRQLLAVVDDGIAAVDAGYEGVSDSNSCITSCYYRDTPGWQRFSAESTRITGAFDRAKSSWEAGVSSANRSIARRALPKQPVV